MGRLAKTWTRLLDASGSYTANQTKGHWSHGPWIESTAVTEINSRAQRSTKRKACRCTQRNQRVQPGSNVLSFSSTLKCQQEFCEPSSPLWILWIRERKRGMWDKTHFSNLKPEKTWKNNMSGNEGAHLSRFPARPAGNLFAKVEIDKHRAEIEPHVKPKSYHASLRFMQVCC